MKNMKITALFLLMVMLAVPVSSNAAIILGDRTGSGGAICTQESEEKGSNIGVIVTLTGVIVTFTGVIVTLIATKETDNTNCGIILSD